MYITKDIEDYKKIKDVLNEYLQEKYISNNIVEYLANKCDNCKKLQKNNLTIAITWTKGNYKLEDLPDSDYKLKKICNHCKWSSSTFIIYRN